MSTNFPTNIDTYTTLVDNVDNVVASHVNDKGDAITALETKLGVSSSAVPTTIDYFLKNVSGAYRTHIHDGTSDDGAKVSYANLADVNFTGLADGEIMKWNQSTGKWINYASTSTFAGLTDVLIVSPQLRDGLYYDSGDSKWKNGLPNATYAS